MASEQSVFTAVCRPIVPNDLFELRAAHQALFPIDYESHFYDCVIHSKDQIFSWAAVCKPADTSEFVSKLQASTDTLAIIQTQHRYSLQGCNPATRKADWVCDSTHL